MISQADINKLQKSVDTLATDSKGNQISLEQFGAQVSGEYDFTAIDSIESLDVVPDQEVPPKFVLAK